MLDMYVSNVLSLKRFHGAEAGNTHECLLKLSIGRVRSLRRLFKATAHITKSLNPEVFEISLTASENRPIIGKLKRGAKKSP
jgi:hypothetical protein